MRKRVDDNGSRLKLIVVHSDSLKVFDVVSCPNIQLLTIKFEENSFTENPISRQPRLRSITLLRDVTPEVAQRMLRSSSPAWGLDSREACQDACFGESVNRNN